MVIECTFVPAEHQNRKKRGKTCERKSNMSALAPSQVKGKGADLCWVDVYGIAVFTILKCNTD